MRSFADPVAVPHAVQSVSMAHAFRVTVEALPDRVAVRTLDDSVSLTWSALRDRADAFACGLAALGVTRGDVVALLLTNRPEFSVADIAAMSLGAATLSLYPTSTPEQLAFVMADAGAQILITEAAFREVVAAARDQVPELRQVVVLEGADHPQELAWEHVEALDPTFDIESAWRAVAGDDVLTLIYTSGTTGPPKGVELRHRNLLWSARAVEQLMDPPPDPRVISWLPAAHIAERGAHHYLPMLFGAEVTTCPQPTQILAYLQAVRPTMFLAVPRIWEKLRAGLEPMLAQDPDKQALIGAAIQKVELEQAGNQVPRDIAALAELGERELFPTLRDLLGLDQAVAVHVGAAPTPRAVLVFFHALGLPVAETWGMSETGFSGCCNPAGRIKIGTVGPPLPGSQVRLANDGELLYRSAAVMSGYRGRLHSTAQAIDADGWLHTGDIAEFDDDGYVRIVDRKREIIINAAGKNMSPANIESTIKGASVLIDQVCVIGDARPYNTALVALDSIVAQGWAANHNVDVGALTGDAAIRQAIQLDIDAANTQLARVEQIKRFAIVGADWQPGGDELTPTMKLKRRPIAAKYAALIEELYA